MQKSKSDSLFLNFGLYPFCLLHLDLRNGKRVELTLLWFVVVVHCLFRAHADETWEKRAGGFELLQAVCATPLDFATPRF